MLCKQFGIMKFKHLITSMVLITLIVLATNVEAQCSMCKAVLESETDGNTGGGINAGIIYMAAVLYLLLGTTAFFVYKNYKKQQQS